MQNWFPLGVAEGKAFCNREEERKRLKHNISHGIHTLISSPRRYGKTSLAQQIIHEMKLPSITIEFTLASDIYTAQNIIYAAVSELITKLMPSYKKALTLATKYFAKLNPKLTIDTKFGTKIELEPKFHSPTQNITELLQGLDKAAKEAKKHVILFMDEFQQVSTLDKHETIEAAIRNAAQRLHNTSIIFSGSNRHLLQSMFDDKTRPLYHLCDRLNLDRIDKQHYVKYLQTAANNHWHKNLTNEVIDYILELTCNHSYYTNVLCSHLWREHSAPTLEKVETVWQNYIDEEKYRIMNELSRLSHHQKLMLMILASNPFNQPTSKDVIKQMRASPGSAAKSFKTLMDQDYIYQATNGYYKILDPAIEHYLKREARTVLGT